MWHTIKALVRRAPVDAWDCYQVRDGQKGPIQVRAIRIPVETRRPRADPRRETLLVMETLDGSDRWHFLTNASDEEPTSVLVRVAGQRHLIEEAFELGKAKRDSTTTKCGPGRVGTITQPAHRSAAGSWFERAGGWEKKAPSMTANLVRSALSELMRKPKSPSEIAAMCLRQLRRNEAARIAHWRAKGLTAPPRRRAEA